MNSSSIGPEIIFLPSCHVQLFDLLAVLSGWVRMNMLLGSRPLNPEVHLMEEEQEHGRYEESHSRHEEPRAVITHLVYEEPCKEKSE